MAPAGQLASAARYGSEAAGPRQPGPHPGFRPSSRGPITARSLPGNPKPRPPEDQSRPGTPSHGAGPAPRPRPLHLRPVPDTAPCRPARAPGGAAELLRVGAGPRRTGPSPSRAPGHPPFRAPNSETPRAESLPHFIRQRGQAGVAPRFLQAPSIASRLQVSRGLWLFLLKMLLLGTLVGGLGETQER